MMRIYSRARNYFSDRKNRVNAFSDLFMVFLFLAFAYGFREGKTNVTAHLNEFSIGTEPMLSTQKISNPGVLEVETDSAVDGALVFTLFQQAPKYPASVVTDLAIHSLEITKKLKSFERNIDNKLIRFTAVAPIKPGIGFEHAEILSLVFDAATLMQIPLNGNHAFQDFLNKSKRVIYISNTGQRYVEAFCSDHVAKHADVFCEREVN